MPETRVEVILGLLSEDRRQVPVGTHKIKIKLRPEDGKNQGGSSIMSKSGAAMPPGSTTGEVIDGMARGRRRSQQ